jgi:excisionase family DNA binding protein
MSTIWLTVAVAAERTGVHPTTVYRQLWAGTFPCRTIRVGLTGRAWRIHAGDLDDWIAAQQPITEEDT